MATFEVVVAASSPQTYQWYEERDGESFAIGGATSARFVTPSLSGQTFYRVVVSNACGSDEATATASVCTDPPVIQTQPEDVYVSPTSSADLRVRLASGGLCTYQWYRGESGDTSDPVPGATSPGMRATATTVAVPFWVRVSNACGSVDSVTARIIPGLVIESISLGEDAAGKAQLLIRGTGITSTIRVVARGMAFMRPAVVKRGKTIIQKGKLEDGTSLKKAFPRGEPVTVAVVDDEHGIVASVIYTRP